MSRTATDSVTTNPDPTKWADRRIEFAQGALGAGAVVVFFHFAGVFAAVGTAAAAAVGVVGTVFAVFAVGAVFAKGQIRNPRPVARRLGMAFSVLATLAGGGYMADKLASVPAPQQKPVERTPEAVFNITARNCDAASLKSQIEQIQKNGFRVTCSQTPTP